MRVTHAWLHAKHAERDTKARHECRVTTVAGSPSVRHVRPLAASQRRRAPEGHYVLLGIARAAFVHDADAVRVRTRTVVVAGDAVEFPLQRGALWREDDGLDPGANVLPIACSCPDWKHRGTDSRVPGQEGLRSSPAAHRNTFRRPEDLVMGAVRGCKHMVAAERWMHTHAAARPPND